jgi:hypothetical protein
MFEYLKYVAILQFLNQYIQHTVYINVKFVIERKSLYFTVPMYHASKAVYRDIGHEWIISHSCHFKFLELVLQNALGRGLGSLKDLGCCVQIQ